MPDLSDTGNFDDGQVEFSCLVVRGQVNIWGVNFHVFWHSFLPQNSVKKRCYLRRGTLNLNVFPLAFGILSVTKTDDFLMTFETWL